MANAGKGLGFSNGALDTASMAAMGASGFSLGAKGKVFWFPDASGDTSGATDSANFAALWASVATYAATLTNGLRAVVKNNGPQLYYLNVALEPQSNTDVDWGVCVFLKAVDGGTPTTNSVVRTYDAATDLTGSAAFTLTFNATLTPGLTTATLSSAWTGDTYAPPVNFPNGDTRNVMLTNGQTSVSWITGLSANAGLTNQAVGATYYGRYKNIKYRVGIFSANNHTCPAQIMRLESVEDFEWTDPCVIHTAGCASWAAAQGGHRIRIINPTVLNGTVRFQDGWHTTHGYDISIIGGIYKSGDDPFALGIDAAGSVGGGETWDDEGLRRVVIDAPVVDALLGCIKVYYGLNTTTNQPFWGTYRGTVNNVRITNVTGRFGQQANGGVYVVDTTKLYFTGAFSGGETSGTLNTPYTGATSTQWLTFSNSQVKKVTLTKGSTSVSWSGALTGTPTATVSAVDPTRLQNIYVSCNIDVGSTSNDGVNSNGIYTLGCTNLTVEGTINIIDTPTTPYFALGRLNMCMGSTINITCPQMPAGPGLSFYNCLDPVVSGKYYGGAGAGRGIIEQTGTRGLKISGEFHNVPTSGSVLSVQGVGSGDFSNTYEFNGFQADKATGATTTRLVIHQSASAGFVTSADVVNGDLRGQSNANAIDAAFNSSGFNPDRLKLENVRGSIAPYTITWASALTIPGVSGIRMQISAAAGDTTFTAPISQAANQGDRISIQLSVDAFASGTRNFTWPATFLQTPGLFVQPVVSTDANKKTVTIWEFDGTNWWLTATNRWIT
jgi:hypothetical protein